MTVESAVGMPEVHAVNYVNWETRVTVPFRSGEQLGFFFFFFPTEMEKEGWEGAL